MKKALWIAVLVLVILFLCAYASIAFGATGSVAKVMFVTDEQSVAVGVLSEPMVIQVQNAQDAEEKLDSTADVIFTSSSETGVFLGSTGKAVTKTMNSGSANKTFYYQDSTKGVHTITAKVVPRTGGDGWSVEQKVYVGEEAPIAADELEGSEESSNDSGVTTEEKKTDEGTHSSQSKLSTYTKSKITKIGAGRNRIAFINSPVHFIAETNQEKITDNGKMNFRWAFGDGDSDSGKAAQHVYYFPGEYNVVLTAYYKGEEVVARTKVKVIDTAIEIANVVSGQNGYIEIKNPGTAEANVIGWKVQSGEWKYVISVDTIINPKSSLRIPNKVMHFSPEEKVELLFPNEESVYVYTKPQIY